MSFEEDAPARWVEEAGGDFAGGGLAAAALTNEADNLSLAGAKRDAIDRLHDAPMRAYVATDIVECDYRRSGIRSGGDSPIGGDLNGRHRVALLPGRARVAVKRLRYRVGVQARDHVPTRAWNT